jgi:hypothetical protein
VAYVHFDTSTLPDDSPAKTFLRALEDPIKFFICGNTGWIEGQGGSMGVNSSLLGLFTDFNGCAQPATPPGGPSKPYLPGTGGQCSTAYRLRARGYNKSIDFPNGRTQDYGPKIATGPIKFTSSCDPPNQNGQICYVTIRDKFGNTIFQENYYSRHRTVGIDPPVVTPGYAYLNLTEMTRLDGGPDDCGNGRPVGGGDNGRPVPPQTPPIIYYTPITINNVVFNVPVTIGPLKINVNAGPFNLSIGINGAQVPISFDGTINLNNNSNSSYFYTDYTTDPPTSEDQKEEEKKANDQLTNEASYRLQAYDCAEEELDDIFRTGSPISLILQAIQDINILDQKRFYQQCEFDIDPLPPITLGSFTAQETEQILEIRNINKSAIGLQIVCTSESANVRPYAYSVSRGLAMARWGVAAVGTTIGGKTTYLPGEPLYYPDDFVTLPDLEVTGYALRLTGVPGCTYTVYDCGLRR